MIVAFLVGLAFGVVLFDLVGGRGVMILAGVLFAVVIVREFDDAIARTEHRRRVRERLEAMERSRG